jgi:hypothetical protein
MNAIAIIFLYLLSFGAYKTGMLDGFEYLGLIMFYIYARLSNK